MSWFVGNQPIGKRIDINTEFDKLVGDLEDKEARVSLAQFLFHNLGLTAELISGVKLFPFQDMILRTWFQRNYNLMVAGRGGAKSYTVAMFCILYSIFHPESRIILVAQNFRSARRIFEQIQRFVKNKNAILLRQCFQEDPSRRNDAWQWTINDGVICCLPLAAGDAIRGTRADVLIVDEFLLIPEDIYKSVLVPFLVSKQNVAEQLKIKAIEDELIKRGEMKEEDRRVFDSGKKIIALSSASFQFEFLYRLYKDWIAKICDPIKDSKATYSVIQMSYEAAPLELIDASVIEEAKSGGSSNAVFQREYCALFTDDSDSYFSAKKMFECTIPDGESPTIEIVGEKDAEYILAIDPSFSSSKSSDDFAFNLMKLNRATKTTTLVHNYAVPGGDLKDHIKYFHYLMTNFNVVWIIMDKAGGDQFISACNESVLFTSSNLKLHNLDINFDDEASYKDSIRLCKYQYNLLNKKIVYTQPFNPTSLRRMNEYLQANIDHKKVLFASHASANEIAFQRMMTLQIPIFDLNDSEYKSKLIDFIDEQGSLIDLTKKECTLIEVKTSQSTGVQSFDLPSHLRKTTSANRARKDSYTCLMLGNWASKIVFDLAEDDSTSSSDFVPFRIG